MLPGTVGDHGAERIEGQAVDARVLARVQLVVDIGEVLAGRLPVGPVTNGGIHIALPDGSPEAATSLLRRGDK